MPALFGQKIAALLLLLVLCCTLLLCAWLLWGANLLHGPDRAAYELLLEASGSFPVPQSVRLLCSELSADCHSMLAELSYRDSNGASHQSCFHISAGGALRPFAGTLSPSEEKLSPDADRVNCAVEAYWKKKGLC